jgi:hypothetical protein
MQMKFSLSIVLLSILFLVASCQEATPVCPTVTSTLEYLTMAPDKLPTPTPASGQFLVEVGRKVIIVDKVVTGPLCNDNWNGTVYVGCDVKVYAWQEQPTFLKNCQLNIDPQTVVYVADHNNTAYYNGCSCHMGITPEP